MLTLSRSFYACEPDVVARELIGKCLVRIVDSVALVGRIVEAEGYRGTDDAASHAASGPTPRNFPMYGPPGHAYVYFIYGMHWMANIVAHPENTPGAVLIRALEPLEGIETMRRNRDGRFGIEDPRLTNGPARLAQALAIDGTLNATDLCSDGPLFVADGALLPGESVASGPRVRVPGDDTARGRPWRFWIAGHTCLSS
jgi:DNA-3-methyladenine glycosylase